MLATKKEEKAIMDCYVQLYANSEPKADFMELLESSPKNSLGETEVPYMDYKISKSDYEKIVTSVIKKYRIGLGYRAKLFRNSIALGCAPAFKKDINSQEIA